VDFTEAARLKFLVSQLQKTAPELEIIHLPAKQIQCLQKFNSCLPDLVPTHAVQHIRKPRMNRWQAWCGHLLIVEWLIAIHVCTNF